MGHFGFKDTTMRHKEDKKPEGRNAREFPPEDLSSHPSQRIGPHRPLWGQTLPVQMESCDLSIVSLKVNEVEEVHGRLLISLLSGRKEGITPWTQTSAWSLRRELMSMTSEKGKQAFMLFMYTHR